MLEHPFSILKYEVALAMNAGIAATKKIMTVYASNFGSTTKDDDSPVTLADTQSNEIIKSHLLAAGHPILSEEDEDDAARLESHSLWIVDPLDGTSDFIKKTGEFTVMIALVKDGLPILGVVCWPIKSTIYVAVRGEGAFRYADNSWTQLSVGSMSELAQCRMVGSKSHLSADEKTIIENLKIKQFQGVGSSLKVMKIASNEADCYLTTTDKMKEWDTAASHCIIFEAGGIMSDLNGNDLIYNKKNPSHEHGILVSNGHLHQDFLQALKHKV